MQIVERGFTGRVRRKYMIPLNAASTNSSVLLEVVYFEGAFLEHDSFSTSCRFVLHHSQSKTVDIVMTQFAYMKLHVTDV